MVVVIALFCDLVPVGPRKALILVGCSLEPNPEALQAGEALRLALCLHIPPCARLSRRLMWHLLSALQRAGWCFSMEQMRTG